MVFITSGDDHGDEIGDPIGQLAVPVGGQRGRRTVGV